MRVQFESSLTPDQLRARLSVYAKPAAPFGWRMGESAFYYRFSGNNRYFLIKTHGMSGSGAAIFQPVFLAKLTEENGLTRIEGHFGWEWRMAFAIFLFCILAVLLITGSFPALVLTAGFLFCMGLLLQIAASAIYAEEERQVLDLIRKKLLA